MAADPTNPAPAPEPGVELLPGLSVPPDAISVNFGPSQGPGGQNVNRRSTRAMLRASVARLGLRKDAEARLRAIAGSKLVDDETILITGDEHRSQGANKQACLARLGALIIEARKVPKTRRATKPTRGSIERRLEGKKKRSDIKKGRKWKPDE